MTAETAPRIPVARDGAADGLAVHAAAVQRRTVRVLIASQILGGIGTSTGFALSSLLAKDVSGKASLAGLAGTFMSVGAAVSSVPLARVMVARGRRLGLVLGYVVGASGTLISVAAAAMHSFWLLLVGTALFGAASAVNLQSRYAGTDLAPAERRGRALAIVIWAATIGSIAGPNLAHPAEGTARALGLPELSGAFLWSAFAFTGAAIILALFLRPDPLLVARRLRGEEGAAPGKQSLKQSFAIIAASPRAVLALAAVAVTHTIMVSIMSMTPVRMNGDGMSVTVIGLVLSVHVAGMYAFSPLVGMAVDRVGRVPVICTGMGFLAAACYTVGTAPMGSKSHMIAGLLLLGIGWSCGVVAGSTLLVESTPESRRPSIQGASDFVMQGTSACGAALAGLVVGTLGYSWLAGLAAALLVPVAVLVAVTVGQATGQPTGPPTGRSADKDQNEAVPRVP